MTADAHTVFAALDATWPAARTWTEGPWRLRYGAGGGNRVSAATCSGDWTPDNIPPVEAAMRDMGQTPLFMIRPWETMLDAALDARGYIARDATIALSCPVETLTDQPVPPVTAFAIWEPLAIMVELWDRAGIGPERRAIMHRAEYPKVGLFGRAKDRPAGVGYCAVHNDMAMVHALEVAPVFRRNGLAQWMMRAAAHWAADRGAKTLTVLVTEENTGARALYDRLRMTPIGGYHYRAAPHTPRKDIP